MADLAKHLYVKIPVTEYFIIERYFDAIDSPTFYTSIL